MTSITHGRIGHGTAVHAFSDGGQLCGSGRSSFAHSFRNPRKRLTDEPVTCKKCLQALASLQKTEEEPAS